MLLLIITNVKLLPYDSFFIVLLVDAIVYEPCFLDMVPLSPLHCSTSAFFCTQRGSGQEVECFIGTQAPLSQQSIQ